MTPAEIYKLQVWLKATKRCAGCREVKLVAEFAGYGVSICNACDIDELEQYFASLKARVGVGAA